MAPSIFEDLGSKIEYLNQEERVLIEMAYCFAVEQHEGQVRANGDPYIIHPLRVAIILAEMFCDVSTIAAALLHDILEDTNTRYEELTRIFGEKIALLVEGLTKINKVKTVSRPEQQAKSFGKMLLATSRDIRIILIKLADRLHNMLTLGNLKIDKRRRIAQETLEIYVPIANHLGLHLISQELEELAFLNLFPMRYRALEKAMNEAIKGVKPIALQVEAQLRETLLNEYPACVFTIRREKRSLYEIYLKMVYRRSFLKNNLDTISFRIILDDHCDCYSILGKIHKLFKPLPGKFKDYIAVPKISGYQSLHSSLFGPGGQIINLKISTQTMDRFASYGIASCWMFQGKDQLAYLFYETAKKWINNLSDLQSYSGNFEEFFDNVKGNLYADKIYVFTPKGRILALAHGATVLDFAYALDRELGNTCVAAKVNHQLVDIFTVLNNGEIVTLINEKNGTPDPRWVSLVRTNLARQKIREFLKNLQEGELVNLGYRLLAVTLVKLGYNFKDFSQEDFNKLQFSIPELYKSIGMGVLLPMVVSYQLINLVKKREVKEVFLENITGIPLKIARCCHPLPGERIGGYFTSNFSIDIHSYSCPVFRKLWSNPQLILETNWRLNTFPIKFNAIISFEIYQDKEFVTLIKQTVEKNGGKTEKITHSKEYRGGYVLVVLDLLVKNIEHLEKILEKIRQIPTVEEVERKTSDYG